MTKRFLLLFVIASAPFFLPSCAVISASYTYKIPPPPPATNRPPNLESIFPDTSTTTTPLNRNSNFFANDNKKNENENDKILDKIIETELNLSF